MPGQDSRADLARLSLFGVPANSERRARVYPHNCCNFVIQLVGLFIVQIELQI